MPKKGEIESGYMSISSPKWGLIDDSFGMMAIVYVIKP
jgi:hypothetical protein